MVVILAGTSTCWPLTDWQLGQPEVRTCCYY